MKIPFECSMCIFRQIRDLAQQAGKDSTARWAFADKLLRALLESRDVSCAPQLAEKHFACLAEATGIPDPFREIKEKSTALAWELRRKMESEKLSFEETLLLAIGGNVIDVGVNPDFKLEDAEKSIRGALTEKFDRDAARDLEKRMDKAKKFFYFLDNCGEAVFDALFIRRYAGKITLGVRGKPILNDITPEELVSSGLGDYPSVDTGRAAPGVIPGECREEFLDAMRSSDLVVAKGQGNYESLCPDFADRPIYHLLRVKCRVIADHLRQPLGSIQIIGRNL
ncbi:MAG: ARMT1-like domain-containing protein [Victivallaceae bacterium]|nr:ARMT1-like domain-containing protein [Victivallaceae bacterium]